MMKKYLLIKFGVFFYENKVKNYVTLCDFFFFVEIFKLASTCVIPCISFYLPSVQVQRLTNRNYEIMLTLRLFCTNLKRLK